MDLNPNLKGSLARRGPIRPPHPRSRTALALGRPALVDGAYDASTIDVAPIDEALALSKTVGVNTSEAKSMYEAATQVGGLRRAWIAGDWNGLEDALANCRLSPSLAEVARWEVEAGVIELRQHQVVGELVALLQRAKWLTEGQALKRPAAHRSKSVSEGNQKTSSPISMSRAK